MPSLEEDDRPAVEPAAFDADGGWTSAPPRLDTDPERSLLSAELREHLLEAIDGLVPRRRRSSRCATCSACPRTRCRELLDITDGNQRVLLHRARARVREALAPLVEVTG